MTNWKHVYEASRYYIRSQTASGLFVAAIYVVIAIFGLYLAYTGRNVDLPIGVLFLAVGTIGGLFLGVQAFRDYYGEPLILTIRVLGKQDAISYSQSGTLHRYFFQVAVTTAMRLSAGGELVPVPCAPRLLLPVAALLFGKVREGDTVSVACTPTGVAFATLEDPRLSAPDAHG